VREFTDDLYPSAKRFVSGKAGRASGVRLKFRDNDCMKAVVPQRLLCAADRGVQITARLDLFMGTTLRIFIPTQSLTEMTVSRRRWHRTGESRPRPFSRAFSTSDLTPPGPNFKQCRNVVE